MKRCYFKQFSNFHLKSKFLRREEKRGRICFEKSMRYFINRFSILFKACRFPRTDHQVQFNLLFFAGIPIPMGDQETKITSVFSPFSRSPPPLPPLLFQSSLFSTSPFKRENVYPDKDATLKPQFFCVLPFISLPLPRSCFPIWDYVKSITSSEERVKPDKTVNCIFTTFR